MNCSSTHLTSDPTRVMFLTWQQPGSTAAALNKFCSICTPNGVYTEFGIDPLKQIQAFLGHDYNSPITSKVYIHEELQSGAKTSAAMDEILGDFLTA